MDQSKLANSGITESKSSFVFARWQHATDGLAAGCSCMFWLGFDPKSALLLGGQRPHLTHLMEQVESKSVKRFNHGAQI